jgi:hypothetical protein
MLRTDAEYLIDAILMTLQVCPTLLVDADDALQRSLQQQQQQQQQQRAHTYSTQQP